MIWKERGVSQNKEKLEVLLRRLPKRHAMYGQAENESYAEAAGIGGEERFDHYFARSPVAFPHIMMHNVMLRSFRAFQLDSLMITPWCIYVFEIKNMNGRLQFMDAPVQLLQTKEDGTVIGRKSPIEQIIENEWLLGEWLETRRIMMPVRSVLVLSYPKQIAENVPASQPVIFSHQLPRFLHQLSEEPPIFNWEEMKSLARMIVAALVTLDSRPICTNPKYSIEVMLRGVWCSACDRIGMVRRYGNWFCPGCCVSDKNAHLRTIRDWLLLTGEPMTNKLGREILCVDDRRLVTRLLKDMNLKKSGSFKDSNYSL
ncbi:nuclease-related domain-containing protein [Metaplanococcus flavidus]|uniref:Nuclease-related domain-containing protein n=1 Tax=Metaplanococcus flavidus TaxID=569883 RepID=A0ABW3LF07_9BACL